MCFAFHADPELSPAPSTTLPVLLPPANLTKVDGIHSFDDRPANQSGAPQEKVLAINSTRQERPSLDAAERVLPHRPPPSPRTPPRPPLTPREAPAHLLQALQQLLRAYAGSE